MDWKCASSCSLLASIENVDFKRLKPPKPDQVLGNYGWHKPEKPILERKKQTDTRREELLDLLYQEGINTGQVEEMIKEWISLVVERDKLLREQLDKENTEEKVDYLRQLREFLKDQPPLGDASEEINIRDALLDLEKQVTQYCRKHQITSPPPSKVQFRSPRQDRQQSSRYSVRGSLHKSLHQQDILDHETGQTGIPVIGDSSQSSSGSNISQNTQPGVEEYDGARPHSAPLQYHANVIPAAINGDKLKAPSQQSNSVGGVGVRKPSDHCQKGFGVLTIPPLPPPPPPPVTPPSSLPMAAVVHPKGGARGVAGTVQFASSNNNFTSGDFETQQKKEIMDCHANNTVPGRSIHRPNAATRCTYIKDSPLECTSTEDRQQLMDEIASAGQSVLRRTTRPKSPGGTPIKGSRNRLTLTGNTDMLQRALITKFRSLHSTPIRHHSPTGAGKSGSFDLSSTWSDINSSCVVYEDPDLSSTPPSMAGRREHVLDRDDTNSRSDNIIVDPNSSTAV